jgi:hypothetical protein
VSWQPQGQPVTQPQEDLRGGTAKLLTLFRPATGEVRAMPVPRPPNAVLHPWRAGELVAILAALPDLPVDTAAERMPRADWEAGRAGRSGSPTLPAARPPLRRLLVLDNLSGHKTPAFVDWLFAHGLLPLDTPLAGWWLNMAESVQRILVRRALDGQHPETATEVMTWLAEVVGGWNADPTPFVWGGKRAARRARARQRRHARGGAGAYSHRPIRRGRRSASCPCKGYVHIK